MSLARHSFANIVPIDKRKLGSSVSSPSQVTSMRKANANTAIPKRFAFGVSSFYRVHSGLINDYARLAGAVASEQAAAILNGQVLDGNGIPGLNLQILDGNGGSPPAFILDGN